MSGSWLLIGMVSVGVAAGAGMARQPGIVPPQQLHPGGVSTPAQPQMIPPKPKEPPSPLAGELDAAAAIQTAKQRAALRGTRVLVIWASDPESEYTKLFVDMMGTTDVRRLLAMEFEPVWAESGRSARAAANREIAKTLGVDVKQGDQHAMLAVLDANGKVLASRSAAQLLDEMRQRAYSAIKAQDFLNANKSSPPLAKDLLESGVSRAKEKGRAVLVTFGEFGNEWSTSFGKWLAQPEVGRAMEPYVVIVQVELLRDKGAVEVMATLGGTSVQSLPWFVFVGPDGKPIVASQTEKTPNIGFPTDDGEIGQFLAMLKQAAPGLRDADSRAIRDSLVEHRTGKK